MKSRNMASGRIVDVKDGGSEFDFMFLQDRIWHDAHDAATDSQRTWFLCHSEVRFGPI